MAQTGHLLFFDIEQPTRDLQVSFDYQDCDIASVSTLDMIPSVRQTRLETPGDTKTPGIIRVALDGWIFPRSGIAFVWTLKSELTKPWEQGPVSKNSAHAFKSSGLRGE